MVFSFIFILFRYLEQYKEQLREELDSNQYAINQKLPQKFQEMLNTMECLSDQCSNGSVGTVINHSNRIYRRPKEERV